VPASERQEGRQPPGESGLNGRRVNIPERAAVVKRIYLLAARGYGHGRIVRLLTAEGVPAFGRSGRWCRAYVTLLLRDRRTLGEHQPRCVDGKADGAVIKGYYEAVVTEQEWMAAQTGQAGRKLVRPKTGGPGRVTLQAGGRGRREGLNGRRT
jgi:hypothetical protein